MVNYNCPRCHKNFKLKGDFTRHMNRKNPCKKLQSNDSDNELSFTCELCKSTFSRKYNLERHVKNVHILSSLVPVKPSQIESQSSECPYCQRQFTLRRNMIRHVKGRCSVRDKVEKEKEELFMKLLQDKEIGLPMVEMNNNSNNIIDNSVTNNNQVNNLVGLNAYGDEDISYISKKSFKRILGSGFKSIPELIVKKHYNENFPENHNVYMSNFRSGYMMIYDGQVWNMKDAETVIDDMYDNNVKLLEEKFHEIKEIMSEKEIKKFERFLDKYEDDNVVRKVKKALRLKTYNKRMIVLATKRLLEKRQYLI